MLRTVRNHGCLVAIVALTGCWASPRAATEAAGSKSPSKLRVANVDFEGLPGAAPDDDFEALLVLADADDNERVTQEEVEALVTRRLDRQVRLRFERLDRDHDGRVTNLEVLTMDLERFARFDRDGDGSFTLAELSHAIHGQALGRCRLLFARWDQDRDGVLSEHDREGLRLARAAAQR